MEATMPLAVWITIGAIFLIWVLLNMKTSRADGTYLKATHPYRRIMPFIMQGRNESIVYYDDYINAEKLLDYLEEAKKHFSVNPTHCCVRAVGQALQEIPPMNRFVVGRRLYKRKNRVITFSMKRKRLDKKAKLTVVRLKMEDNETFQELCERINGKISVERSEKKTYVDKELSLFTKVPRPLMNWFITFFKWLDYHNVLPNAFIQGDGMYTSVFIANLGSVGMSAAYHHLYEWGNCPLFMMVGKIEDRPVVVDGKVTVQKTLHVRWSYDERIDDGLTSSYGMAVAKRILENPYEELGCIPEAGSEEVSASASA
jgi:hypothetical protein